MSLIFPCANMLRRDPYAHMKITHIHEVVDERSGVGKNIKSPSLKREGKFVQKREKIIVKIIYVYYFLYFSLACFEIAILIIFLQFHNIFLSIPSTLVSAYLM